MKWMFWKRSEEPMPAPGQPDWERALINRLALDYLRDRRRAQRWGLAFRAFILVYLFGLLMVASLPDLRARAASGEEHVALIEVKGVISAGSEDRKSVV